VRYDQFLGSEPVDQFKKALKCWHSTLELKNMLSPSPSLSHQLKTESEVKTTPVELPYKKHSEEKCTKFLTLLHAQYDSHP
jgi:hypothetical protein